MSIVNGMSIVNCMYIVNSISGSVVNGMSGSVVNGMFCNRLAAEAVLPLLRVCQCSFRQCVRALPVCSTCQRT